MEKQSRRHPPPKVQRKTWRELAEQVLTKQPPLNAVSFHFVEGPSKRGAGCPLGHGETCRVSKVVRSGFRVSGAQWECRGWQVGVRTRERNVAMDTVAKSDEPIVITPLQLALALEDDTVLGQVGVSQSELREGLRTVLGA